MTAIAYRAGVLAADSMTMFAEAATHTLYERKIMRIGEFAFGVAGDKCPENEDITQWLFDGHGRLRTDARTFKSKYAFIALLMHDDGRVWVLDQRGNPSPLKTEFFAIGSGADVCFGAMELGATAEQAVAAAIKWNGTQCGGPIISEKAKNHDRNR